MYTSCDEYLNCPLPWVVLHAQDMTGGRVLTVPFWDDFTELGAQWLYGTYTNPITALATFFGAPRALARSQLKLGENGALPVIHANASNAEADMLAGISSTALSISFDALRVLLDTRYDSKASISSSASIEGFELRGPVAVSLGGLSNITQGLTNMINASRAIMLNAPVATIHVGDLNTTVDLVNGTSFSSQYVVCTLPLGVLQAGSVKFDPPLPEQADAVITNLGVSTVNPVHLWFDGPFWNPEAEQLTLRTQPTSGWKEFLSMYTFTGQPLLIGFPGSVASTSVEFMSDEAAVNTVLAALRQEYGTTRVPFPQAYMVTRWGLNPFARGTHSFYTPGTSPSNRSTLAEPVGGSLLFAGEAVSARHPSTMHGAFSSGIAQAARILAAMEFPDGGGASDQCLAECYESQDVSVPGSDDKQQLASNDCN
jgi:polyamine oxidase